MSKRILLLLITLLPLSALQAQVVVQVVTKKIDRSFSYRDGYQVNLEGDNAEVWVESWDKNEIHIHLELIAKHPERSVAENDLEKIKYLAERVKNNIYVRNYIKTEAGEDKPQSNLSARYTITLPENCPVYVKNYFGETNVQNLTNQLRIASEFSKIGLKNIQGKINMRTRFGDIEGEQLDGTVSINSRRSNILLQDIKGTYDITAHYGKIEIFAEQHLINLDIDAEKSDVAFHTSRPGIYGYNLTADNGSITVPTSMNFNFLEDTDVLKRVSFQPPAQEYFASITIKVTFGELTIEERKP